MISPQTMADTFERNITINKRKTQGLSHEESLIQLPFRTNCLNWIVGHTLTNREAIFDLIGAPQSKQDIPLERHQRESEPIREDSQGVQPSHAGRWPGKGPIQPCRTSTRHQAGRLPAGDRLLRQRRENPRGLAPLFYVHDGYHTAQTKIPRKAAGPTIKSSKATPP